MMDTAQNSIDRLVDPTASQAENQLLLNDAKLSELSHEFIGRWTHLISTTNWEKGKIICMWRDALMGSECGPAGYSDEAWSQRVGGVSAQHVGRLRRVHMRFGETCSSYPRLYWSHFLAALDWDDAELWLEGAVQSNWSVSQMRRMRCESLGMDPEGESATSALQAPTEDEDYVPLVEIESSSGVRDGSLQSEQTGPRYDDPDFGEDDPTSPENQLESTVDDLAPWEDASSSSAMSESPFAKLPSLPVDMAEALEQFKLAIIRHRANQWSEVSKEDTVMALEALKTFALQSA